MSEVGLRSGLYEGVVAHVRPGPPAHRFSYRLAALLIDLDELPRLRQHCRLLGLGDRSAPIAFREADHGPGDGSPLRPWVADRLAEAGIESAGRRVMLSCFPRVLGHVFNPLAVYYVFDGERLTAALLEVANTFGQRCLYAVPGPLDASGRLRRDMAKTLPVSPFLVQDLDYRFTLRPPAAEMAVTVRAMAGARLLLAATHRARRLELTDANLARCLIRHRWQPWRITMAIHWQALLLWRKGACYLPPGASARRHAAPLMREA